MYGLPKDFDGSRLVGRFLLQICYGIGQVQLRFDGTLIHSGYKLAIVQSPAAPQPRRIDIPGEPAVQSALLRLLHHTIVKAFGDDEGTLTMEFDDGQILQCLEARSPYESYQIIQGDHQIIV